ncbi:MAG TPA: PSD1 and planctomycete cytochrome C domain-containing protein, partial [Gemmataceae bacterium]
MTLRSPARLPRLIPLLCAAFLASPARGQAPPADLDPDHAAKMARGTDLFKKHVRGVLVGKCLKCHGGDRVESEFDLVRRDGLLKGGLMGRAVVPGDAKASLLYQLVSHAREPHMPSGRPKLPEEAVAHIREWIDLGAPYDAPLLGREDALAWTTKVVPDDAKQFWSFRPLKRVGPPAVRDASWARTPLDRFILAKLEAKGIAPNPPAEKRKLLRRVYLDLLGVPPTPQEADAFLNDGSPRAYERLVDRLLKSPHFGERWARHWLDLARFAESHGFEHDYDRPYAYHYRDFVIEAFNRDLPFDTFVKWQLAGDEFAPEDPLALKATGFLAAGVHSTQITKNEVEKHRYDELDDMLATTGTAMLGLSLGCARCHDHKYDPIPQADYYRMLATFTTTVRSEMEVDLDPEGYRKAKEAFDREHAPFEEALRRFEREQLPGRLAAWEKSSDRRAALSGWVVPEIRSMKSGGGATLKKLDDGSVLVGGKNPTIETLTFVLHTDMAGITGLRLEALSDPSLVKGGPGRAANGNFALTDLEVKAAPKQGGKATAVKLTAPRATFEQKGFAVAGALDADPVTSGWAVDPQFGKDHAAAFRFESPIGFEGGTVLTVTLKFQNNVGHGIGRPRIALTTAAELPALTAPPVPAAVREALAVDAGERSAGQTEALLRWYRTIDPEWRKLDRKRRDHLAGAPKPNKVKVLISSEGVPAVRLHTQGADFFETTYFLRRGDPAQKEGEATPGFLQVLMPGPGAAERWQEEPPQGWRTSYRRRAFANWLTDAEHGAGHLLARVIVNRLWQHYLGRGIVATPSDFGTRGAPPTHPELLDHLAAELIRNGWRLKPIHKLILTSAVYRQSSDSDEAREQKDRENELFWRFNPRRLEAEAIRDSLLAVGGLLDEQMFGPGTLDESSKRRSIYFTVKRSKLIGSLIIFDAPDGTVGVGRRPTTTVAPQALHLMNSPQVREYARGLARRAAPDPAAPAESAIRQAYRIALTRDPTPTELAEALVFVRQQEESYRAAGKPDARELALADFCQVVMCLN